MLLTVRDSDMAFGRPLANGLTRLVVLGVDWTMTPDQGADALAALLAGHAASGDLAFVAPGTPTNNTGSNRSGFSTAPSEQVAAWAPPLAGTDPDTATAANAGRLAAALGVDAAGLAVAPGAGDRHHALASALVDALWEATGGYYASELLDPLGSDANTDHIRVHAATTLFASGPLPAIRLGPQPYGVLPIASRRLAPHLDSAPELNLHRFSGMLRSMWDEQVDRVPHLGRVGDEQDVDDVLLELLQRTPVPWELRWREMVAAAAVDGVRLAGHDARRSGAVAVGRHRPSGLPTRPAGADPIPHRVAGELPARRAPRRQGGGRHVVRGRDRGARPTRRRGTPGAEPAAGLDRLARSAAGLRGRAGAGQGGVGRAGRRPHRGRSGGRRLRPEGRPDARPRPGRGSRSGALADAVRVGPRPRRGDRAWVPARSARSRGDAIERRPAGGAHRPAGESDQRTRPVPRRARRARGGTGRRARVGVARRARPLQLAPRRLVHIVRHRPPRRAASRSTAGDPRGVLRLGRGPPPRPRAGIRQPRVHRRAVAGPRRQRGAAAQRSGGPPCGGCVRPRSVVGAGARGVEAAGRRGRRPAARRAARLPDRAQADRRRPRRAHRRTPDRRAAASSRRRPRHARRSGGCSRRGRRAPAARHAAHPAVAPVAGAAAGERGAPGSARSRPARCGRHVRRGQRRGGRRGGAPDGGRQPRSGGGGGGRARPPGSPGRARRHPHASGRCGRDEPGRGRAARLGDGPGTRLAGARGPRGRRTPPRSVARRGARRPDAAHLWWPPRARRRRHRPRCGERRRRSACRPWPSS